VREEWERASVDFITHAIPFKNLKDKVERQHKELSNALQPCRELCKKFESPETRGSRIW